MDDFVKSFYSFSKFGNRISDGTKITLWQSNKWMKLAGIFDGNFRKLDATLAFAKLKLKEVDLEIYEKFLDAICKIKNLNLNDVKTKMSKIIAPDVDPEVKLFKSNEHQNNSLLLGRS